MDGEMRIRRLSISKPHKSNAPTEINKSRAATAGIQRRIRSWWRCGSGIRVGGASPFCEGLELIGRHLRFGLTILDRRETFFEEALVSPGYTTPDRTRPAVVVGDG